MKVVGAWSAADPPTWEGTAVSSEPSVAAVVLRQPSLTCWAKSKPGVSHALKLLLHPRDFDGRRVQPIANAGTGFLAQSVECVVPKGTLPAIEPELSLAEGDPKLLATLSDAPDTRLYLLFFAKTSVKVGRNHIWRPKPPALLALAEPFRSAMAAGRAGHL